MDVAERLTQLIDSNNVTPYKISRETGISESVLSRILNKSTRKPQNNTLKILAKYFQVSEEWLQRGTGVKSKNETINEIITIPADVWELIKEQNIALKQQAESLVRKDEQIERIITLLENQLDELKKNNIHLDDNAIHATGA